MINRIMNDTNSQLLLFSQQLLNLAWGCSRHVMTENKDNKDRYFIQKSLLINFAAYEGTFDTQTNKNKFFVHLKPRTGKVLI